MTDRLLSMLNQFLLSHQNLELNETFQIYLKILSVEHSKFKASSKPNKKKKRNFKVHVGASERRYNYIWAIDVPQTPHFVNKCLLTCTILALTQHSYFDSDKKDKTFLYLSQLNSSLETKKEYALKILTKQLEKLFQVTKLQQTGPYELKTTVMLLSQAYKCQFFIFDCLNNSSKVYYMYPKIYDDSLRPVFLFRPQFDSHHVIFIRRLNSFFKANSFICFGCLRTFKRIRDSRCPHLCRSRPTCFVCRRFFQNKDTYTNELIKENFCDKLTTSENAFNCPRCNCTIYSNKCFQGHKKFCNGKGYFGYKCVDCNTFKYCKNNTSNDLKLNHFCFEGRTCKNCYSTKESNHQCPLKLEKEVEVHIRLAFYKIIFDNDGLPLFIIFFREEERRGNFTKYIFFENCLNKDDIIEHNSLDLPYFSSKWCMKEEFPEKLRIPTKSIFFQLLENLNSSTSICLAQKILRFLLNEEFSHCCYISEDSSSTNSVKKVDK